MLNDKHDIYENGYRLNVGIVLCNDADKVLMGQRFEGQNWWQFPQGGMKIGESVRDAMFRELQEEIGLKSQHVRVLAEMPRWLRYRLPAGRLRSTLGAIGQKQRWFLLRMTCPDHAINISQAAEDAEFARWAWVSYWEPVIRVVRFKRRVYRETLEYFSAQLERESS